MAGSAKMVLVSYLDRNKVISIPADIEEGSVKYVIQELKKSFNLENSGNMVVVLQRYDPLWEMNIDLEEDDLLANKDKLKVVMIPVSHEASKFSEPVTPVPNTKVYIYG